MDAENITSIAEMIRNGGIGVVPTDTVYGLVGSALLPDAVERIYFVKQRNTRKPLIVLISRMEDVEQFGVELSDSLIQKLNNYWPGPYSVVLPTMDEQFDYLTRETGTIAFRLPRDRQLLSLIDECGPIVAPSANPESFPSARTCQEARRYFGSDVDFYLDGGESVAQPSTLISLVDGDENLLRQ